MVKCTTFEPENSPTKLWLCSSVGIDFPTAVMDETAYYQPKVPHRTPEQNGQGVDISGVLHDHNVGIDYVNWGPANEKNLGCADITALVAILTFPLVQLNRTLKSH